VECEWLASGLSQRFFRFLTTTEPDILAIQETKILSPDLLPTELKTVKNYNVFGNAIKLKLVIVELGFILN